MERELYYENNINIGLYHLHNEAISDLFGDIDHAIGEFLADTNFKAKMKNTIIQAYLEGKLDGVKNKKKEKGE